MLSKHSSPRDSESRCPLSALRGSNLGLHDAYVWLAAGHLPETAGTTAKKGVGVHQRSQADCSGVLQRCDSALELGKVNRPLELLSLGWQRTDL